MYESHFGFTGAPFGLNPDPAFFFGSRGHSSALSYLKFGVYQSEGFVVVTGDIGAGKTTLVRTLLSELDPGQIVASQIVSTQLEASDLLQSVALSFGIPPKTLSKAELLATIEAFLTVQVTRRKRALLIVDEAQNLKREAVEELRMLSNFQLGNRALLQSFLVGQPSLRELLVSKPMEQLRQRVIASCHLGPMDRAETQAYIEHRLRHVGWSGNPSFDAPAFDRIYHWTEGIPRRVNLLCNRLLLASYLESQANIGAAQVDRHGTEAGEEIIGPSARPPSAEPPTSVPASDAVDARPVDRRPVTIPRQDPATHTTSALASHRVGPLLCVASSGAEDVEMAALLSALKAQTTLPSLLYVRIGQASDFVPNDSFFDRLNLDVPIIHLAIREATATQQMASVLQRFPPLIDEHRPSAIIVAGSSDCALACSLASSKMGTRLVHVGAGTRSRVNGDDVNAILIDRLSDGFYAQDNSAYLNLIREGVDESRVHLVGPLLVDATKLAEAEPMAPARVLQLSGALASLADDEGGYGMVFLEKTLLQGSRDAITMLLSSLHQLAREATLVWPVPAAVEARLAELGLREQLHHERLSVVAPVTFAQSVALLKGAAMVVTDCPDVRLQAGALGVRCLMVDMRNDLSLGAPKGGMPLDGQSGRRIAEHLGPWLSQESASALTH